MALKDVIIDEVIEKKESNIKRAIDIIKKNSS